MCFRRRGCEAGVFLGWILGNVAWFSMRSMYRETRAFGMTL